MPSLQQQGTNTASAATVITAFPRGAVQAGSLLVACAAASGFTSGAALTLTGWTKALATQEGLDAVLTKGMQIFYKQAVGTETQATVTVAAATTVTCNVYEIAGASTVLDGTPVGSTSGASTVTTLATGALTTVNPYSIVVAACAHGGILSAPAWSVGTLEEAQIAQVGTFDALYQPFTPLTAFTDTASWTTAEFASTIIAAFLPQTQGFMPYFPL